MTGPEHYSNAESDLDAAARADDKGHYEDSRFYLSRAQARAPVASSIASVTADLLAPDGQVGDESKAAWKAVLR